VYGAPKTPINKQLLPCGVGCRCPRGSVCKLLIQHIRNCNAGAVFWWAMPPWSWRTCLHLTYAPYGRAQPRAVTARGVGLLAPPVCRGLPVLSACPGSHCAGWWACPPRQHPRQQQGPARHKSDRARATWVVHVHMCACTVLVDLLNAMRTAPLVTDLQAADKLLLHFSVQIPDIDENSPSTPTDKRLAGCTAQRRRGGLPGFRMLALSACQPTEATGE
jgi:hypothetical protein